MKIRRGTYLYYSTIPSSSMPGTFVDFLFEPPWIYALMVGGTLVGVWWLMKKYGLLPGSAERFKGQTLKEIIQDDNIFHIVQTFGENVTYGGFLGLLKRRGKLVFHLKTVDVNRVAAVPARMCIRTLKKGGRFKKDTYEFTTKEKRFLIFKKGGGYFEKVPLLNLMHSKPEYFVIDDDEKYVHKDITGKMWSINKNTFPHTFGGVWIFTQDGVSFLTELAYKKMQENDKEESVNALKRFIFYNDQHTGRISAMERKQELKDDSWEKGKQAVE